MKINPSWAAILSGTAIALSLATSQNASACALTSASSSSIAGHPSGTSWVSKIGIVPLGIAGVAGVAALAAGGAIAYRRFFAQTPTDTVAVAPETAAAESEFSQVIAASETPAPAELVASK